MEGSHWCKERNIFFRKGEVVFTEGEQVKGIYFVYNGVVKISKKWGPEKQLILRFAKPGDILGHRGLGGELTYPISGTAITTAKLCYIQSDFLEATLKTNNSFTYQLLQVYAAELRKAERRTRDLAHRDVKGRIALVLLELQNLFGLDGENFITLALSRQDIASFAGTSYETVFKFFTELEETGIVTTSGKKIRVNKLASLNHFVQAQP